MVTKNIKNRSMVPSPEVQHLTTLFRRIQNGEIRVPAFQRGYVWRDRDVIELLTSVYKGYPIGSLLFWKIGQPAEIHLMTVDELTDFDGLPPLPFPLTTSSYSVSYVLDGVQRLSTLFGVFFAPDITEVFRVVFDLENEVFLFKRDVDDTNPRYVSLSALFDPRKLLEAHSRMARSDKPDVLLQASLDLQAAFQDYLLPVVSIVSSNIDEVVEIFERVNSTGSKLSRFDFMRALTWSNGFDFNKAIRELREGFSDTNFDFAPETLIKVVAIVLGQDPSAKSMVEMRHLSAERLLKAVDDTKHALVRSSVFLAEQCAVYSSKFIPYEGQLLVLAKLFHLSHTPSPEILNHFRHWFWTTSFSETLRGKPDSYVTQFLRAVEAYLNGDNTVLRQPFLLRVEDLHERRMLVGGALSTSVALLFSESKAHSIFNGNVIEQHDYLNRFVSDDYQPIIPVELQTKASSLQRVNSVKVLANICVVSKEDRQNLKSAGISVLEAIKTISTRIDTETAMRILNSQLISEPALGALQRGDYDEFIKERATTIYQAASRLSNKA